MEGEGKKGLSDAEGEKKKKGERKKVSLIGRLGKTTACHSVGIGVPYCG